MTRTAAFVVACLLAGCASKPNLGTPGDVVRSKPPLDYASTISNYVALTTRSRTGKTELSFGTPERGNCPLGQGFNGRLGWVVPVQISSLGKDGSLVTITKKFFWFEDERLKGVTLRIEECP
jgi:hypothetical protein